MERMSGPNKMTAMQFLGLLRDYRVLECSGCKAAVGLQHRETGVIVCLGSANVSGSCTCFERCVEAFRVDQPLDDAVSPPPPRAVLMALPRPGGSPSDVTMLPSRHVAASSHSSSSNEVPASTGVNPVAAQMTPVDDDMLSLQAPPEKVTSAFTVRNPIRDLLAKVGQGSASSSQSSLNIKCSSPLLERKMCDNTMNLKDESGKKTPSVDNAAAAKTKSEGKVKGYLFVDPVNGNDLTKTLLNFDELKESLAELGLSDESDTGKKLVDKENVPVTEAKPPSMEVAAPQEKKTTDDHSDLLASVRTADKSKRRSREERASDYEGYAHFWSQDFSFSRLLKTKAKVHIMYIWNPLTYTVVADDDNEFLERFQTVIAEYVSKDGEIMRFRRKPMVDEVVIAPYLDLYYRGRVDVVGEDKCLVEFIDYGAKAHLSFTDLLAYPHELCVVPILGLKVRITGVEQKDLIPGFDFESETADPLYEKTFTLHLEEEPKPTRNVDHHYRGSLYDEGNVSIVKTIEAAGRKP